MANAIKTPDSAWHSQDVTLSGRTYTITQKWNIRDNSWYIDIERPTGEALYGLKVMPMQNLTGRYKYKSFLDGGSLWCMRVKQDFSPITRDNLGVGKIYELWWLTDQEAEELGIDGTIQL